MTVPAAEVSAGPRLSLRARLTLAFAASMAAILVGLGALLYVQLGASLLDGVDQALRSRAAVAVLSGPADRPGAPPLVDPDEAFAQVLDRSGRVLDATAAVSGSPLVSPAVAGSLTGPTYLTRSFAGAEAPARLLAMPAGSGRPEVIVVGATLGNRADALHQLVTMYAVAGPVGIGLSSLAGWALAGVALRPITRIRRRADAIVHTDPSARLPVPATGDELSRLSTTLNSLLARMQEALEREHRFVDDASHELRTPLAVLKAELDLAAVRPRTAEEFGVTIRAAARETDRLARLAEDLLVLARARGGRLPLLRVEVRLPAVLDESLATLRRRARLAGTRIEVRADEQTVRVDPDRLRQALSNLVDNALTHGRGPVLVTADVTPGWLRIEVSDRGPGFPDDLLGSAFQPFTRRRSADPGQPTGSGLGLAVVEAVVLAHGGTATARNQPAGGGCVRIDLRTQG